MQLDHAAKFQSRHDLLHRRQERVALGRPAADSGRWLIEHLLQVEATDRAVRSVNYQIGAAKFPAHRDLASFEFEASKVDRVLVEQLADMAFRCHASLNSSGHRLHLESTV